jgi:hypothetical protein
MALGGLLLILALAAVVIHPTAGPVLADLVGRVSTLTGAGIVAVPTAVTEWLTPRRSPCPR